MGYKNTDCMRTNRTTKTRKEKYEEKKQAQ